MAIIQDFFEFVAQLISGAGLNTEPVCLIGPNVSTATG